MTDTAEETRDAWAAFEARLAKALEAMEPATYLVVSLAGSPRAIASAFVQFAQGGKLGFRAEAAGNQWLGPEHGASEAQHEKLAELGWQQPGSAPQGRNWVREWDEPAPFAEVASIAVRTLREVYAASLPDTLAYRFGGFPAHHGPVPDPELGIPRDRPSEEPAEAVVGSRTHPAPEPDEAVASLEAALSEFVSGADLVPDRDGDLPIRVGSALMFVRPVAGRPPLLQLFSPLVADIDLTPALLSSLNDINRNILFGRVFWAERQIVVSMELTGVGLSAKQIAFGCVQLGNLADHLDDVLRGRFGGRTMFEVPKTLVN